MLKERGIKPEQLPPGEDTVKIKRRLSIDERNILKAANKKSK
jgi:DNA-damage-inducible protein D